MILFQNFICVLKKKLQQNKREEEERHSEWKISARELEEVP